MQCGPTAHAPTCSSNSFMQAQHVGTSPVIRGVPPLLPQECFSALVLANARRTAALVAQPGLALYAVEVGGRGCMCICMQALSLCIHVILVS